SALPCTSNVDLLRYGEGIVHINAEIPRSFLRVSRGVAQSGHPELQRTGPLLGVKRTCPFALQMSAFDPKRKSQALYFCQP
ncbi:MAG: hypothetical protein WB390_13845, partial [Pseudolabrys sp.]